MSTSGLKHLDFTVQLHSALVYAWVQ